MGRFPPLTIPEPLETFADTGKVVFCKPYGEAGILVTAFGKLILCTMSGVFVASDSLNPTWTPLLGVDGEVLGNVWCVQGFKGKLYIPSGYYPEGLPSKTRLHRWDGVATTPELVLELDGGIGGGGGLIESLGVFNDALLVGRREQVEGHGSILRSETGDFGSFSEVFDSGVAKSIYQFLVIVNPSPPPASFCYALTGEPIGAPSWIYRADTGLLGSWGIDPNYPLGVPDVGWFRSGTESERANLEATAPDAPTMGYVTDGRGHLLSYDGLALERMLRRAYANSPNEVACRIKRCGNILFFTVAHASVRPSRGELWSWEGEQLNCLLQTSAYSIKDVEVWQGHLWVCGDTCVNPTGGWNIGVTGENAVTLVVKYPLNLTGKKVPFSVPLWEDKAVTTAGARVGRVPLLGYGKATIQIVSNQNGRLYPQTYEKGAWRDFDAEGKSVPANILTSYRIIESEIGLAGLRFVPNADAIVSARINVGG